MIEKKYIIIEADTNDGDYISKKSLINDDQVIKLKEILKKIGKNSSISWYTQDMINEKRGNFGPDKMYEAILSNEDLDFMENFIPNGEYGIHTLESFEILTVINEEKL